MLKQFEHTKDTPMGREIWEHHSKENRIIVKWQKQGITYLLKMNYSDDEYKILNFTGTEIGILESEYKNCILLRKKDIICEKKQNSRERRRLKRLKN